MVDSTNRVFIGKKSIMPYYAKPILPKFSVLSDESHPAIYVYSDVNRAMWLESEEECILAYSYGDYHTGIDVFTDGEGSSGGSFTSMDEVSETFGVIGKVYSPLGIAGYFENMGYTGNSYALYAKTYSDSGYAGYFDGQVASSSTFTGTNFILNSDYRYKYGIRDAENLYWVDRLDFKTFRMIDDPKARKRFGLVAQDVEKIMPDFVYTNEEGYKSLGYTDILIAVVARQKQQILDLQERVERLEMLINEKYAK